MGNVIIRRPAEQPGEPTLTLGTVYPIKASQGIDLYIGTSPTSTSLYIFSFTIVGSAVTVLCRISGGGAVSVLQGSFPYNFTWYYNGAGNIAFYFGGTASYTTFSCTQISLKNE